MILGAKLPRSPATTTVVDNYTVTADVNLIFLLL